MQDDILMKNKLEGRSSGARNSSGVQCFLCIPDVLGLFNPNTKSINNKELQKKKTNHFPAVPFKQVVGFLNIYLKGKRKNWVIT